MVRVGVEEVVVTAVVIVRLDLVSIQATGSYIKM